MAENLKSTEIAFPHARIMAGGTLVFPAHLDPPKAIQGYKQDPNDKHTFRPVLTACKFRCVNWRKVCGGWIQSMQCSKFQIAVKVIDCQDCTDGEP